LTESYGYSSNLIERGGKRDGGRWVVLERDHGNGLASGDVICGDKRGEMEKGEG
jgi:hypothetical protein